MKALQMNRNVLTWIGMCSADESTKKWQKISFKLIGFTFFMLMVISMIISGAFLIKFISIDMEESLFAVFQMVIAGGTWYMIIFAYLLRKQISATVDGLQKIYDTFAYDESFQYLAKANSKSKWSLDLYFKYAVKWFGISMILASLGSVALCRYMHGEIIKKYLYHPHRFVLPWNQSSLGGYLAEVSFSIISTTAYTCFNGAVLTLFIAMCWHHQAFNEMLQHFLRQLNQPNQNRKHQEQIICKIIRFHIQIKEWFNLTAEVFSSLVLMELIDSMMTAAILVFQLDLKLKHIDHEVIFIISAIFISVGNLFLYCYFGANATHSYEEMIDSLYNTNWEELPVKLQKYFIIMIANAQQPAYYHGFGVAILNLGTFTKFIKAIFTYYMIFKTITTD